MPNRVYDYLLAALFLLLSLLTMRVAYDYTLIRLVVVNLFVATAAAGFLAARRPMRLPLTVLIPLAAFLLFTTVSIAFSYFPAATLREVFHLVTFVGLFLVGLQLNLGWPGLVAWLAGAVILCFFGLNDYALSNQVVTPLGNKNFFAGYLVLAIPVFAAVLGQELVTMRRPAVVKAAPGRNASPAAPPRWNRLPVAIGLTLGLVLMLVLLFRADSQAAFLGTAVGLGCLAAGVAYHFFTMRRPPAVRRLVQLAILVVVLAALAAGSILGLPSVRRNVRMPLWVGSVRMIRERPLTGFGPGSFLAAFQQFRPAEYYQKEVAAPLSDHSHNEFLETAAENGLPALAAFLALLVGVFVILLRGLGRPPEWAVPGRKAESEWISAWRAWFLRLGFLGSLLAILVDGQFSTNLRTFTVGPLFWLLLGMAAGGAPAAPAREPSAAGRSLRNSGVWLALIIFALLSGAIREVRGQVYYKLGIMDRNLKSWESAIRNYRRSLELDPANLQAAYKMAYAYGSSGQMARAEATYLEILRVSPNFAKTYYNLALLMLQRGDRDSALKYLALSRDYDPYDQESLRLDSLLREGPELFGRPPGGRR